MGVGMVSRGEVALAIAAIGLNEGIINQQAFSTAVVMTLVTTLVTLVMLKGMFARRPHPAAKAAGTLPTSAYAGAAVLAHSERRDT